MLSLTELKPTAQSPVLNLAIRDQQKGVLNLPDEASRDALLACLRQEQRPEAGSLDLPPQDQYHILPAETGEAGEDPTLKTVLTQPYQRLLTSLRKYEQLSIQMSKHFSPMQLGGYMEQMEELEQFISQYEAWELEANLRAWQEGLQVPDLSRPYREVTLQQQWAVRLIRAFVLPAPLTVLPDPTPFLTRDQRVFLIREMRTLSTAWLVVSMYEESQPWPRDVLMEA